MVNFDFLGLLLHPEPLEMKAIRFFLTSGTVYPATKRKAQKAGILNYSVISAHYNRPFNKSDEYERAADSAHTL